VNLLDRRSIQGKLTRILVVTVGTALLLAAAVLLAVETAKTSASIRRDLVTQADIIGLSSEAALTFNDPKVGEQNLRALSPKHGMVAAAIYDAQGRLFASVRFDSAQPQPPAVRPADGIAFGLQHASVVRPVLQNRERIGSVYILVRHGIVVEILQYLAWLVAVMLASLSGAILLLRRLQRGLTAPILDVSRVAQSVLDRGTFNVRAVRTTDDEVGRLVDAFNAMLDELGNRARVLREANEALSASEARYQLAAQGSSAGLWDWDLDNDTMFVSPRFKTALGYSDSDFPDRPSSLLGIVHPEDQSLLQAAIDAHLADASPLQAECRLRDVRGDWHWFLVTGMARRTAQGRPFRMAGSLVDVTQRKQSELLLHEANQAKDTFLATLAHELRNPLAPLRTGVQILKSPKAAPSTVQRTLETMDRQLTHMVRLIDDLLDISRISSGKIRLELARVSLRRVIQTAVDLGRPAMDAAGHSLSVELPDPDVPLQGDDTRLTQAFGNLLNNAAKYTPPGGRVRIRAWQEGQSAIVEVSDNGIGIPGDMLETVFDLFTQVNEGAERSPGGLGIGLFLVRSLVEMHGGSIAAASAGPGQGTMFTVRLPCVARVAAQDAGAREAVVERGVADEMRVLVVDDNIDAAETLSTFLEMTGMHTRMAHTGPAAVDAALDYRPDVVLLDIGLPGIDGYEVARRIRSRPEVSRVLLIALTGWGTEADQRRAREAGFDHHLTKPVDVGALDALLRQKRRQA
jgi:PAS domain S-box-containing protein